MSWCGETLNDAVSANSQDFNSNIQYNNPDSFTVKQIFEAFNGKYTPILPVAATSTLWNSLELWRPDFTLKPGYVLTLGSACESVNNTFFANNESNLDNPTSIAYQQLAGCLLSNILIGSVPVQSFSHCGNAANSTVIPYESCILISNIASASINNSGVAIQPTQVDYDSDILSIYKDSISHSVGYSFFALEWPSTNNPLFDKITPNKSVQEPWYAGFNYSQNSSTVAYDPYYNRSNNMQQWESIATLINKYY